MPNFKFSESSGTFYPDDVFYTNAPSDLVDVVPGEYEKCMARNANQCFRHIGNGVFEVFDMPPAPPVIPQKVTKFQAKAALHMAGLLETVEAAIQSEQTDFLTKLAWNEVNSFERQSSMVLNLAAVLNLSEEQLDQLFVTAAAIN